MRRREFISLLGGHADRQGMNFVRVSCEFASDAIAELRWREPR